MATKKTIKDYYNDAIEVAKSVQRDDLVEFFEGRIAALEKKSENRKPTAKQEQNEDYKDIIVDVLTNSDTGMTIKEIVAAAGARLEGADSTSKMSSLLRQLRLDGKVERTYDKKVAYFSAVKEVA